MIEALKSIRDDIQYSSNDPFKEQRLEEIRAKRTSYVEAAQDNNFTDGLKNLLTRLYPDNAHFVYELLQNAEDAQATRVDFVLQEDCLYFLHDGTREFSIDDVDSITSIGKSQKVDDTNKIGKFGVGFKSVFSYTNSPSIHTNGLSFLIQEMLIPSSLPAKHLPNPFSTLFIFPFNNPEKEKDEAFNEIFRLFKKLTDNTLLFLSNIKEIHWNVADASINSIQRVDHPNYVEISSSIGERSFWYLFTKEVCINPDSKNEGNFPVKIAYAFDKDEGRIIETEGGVSIFFPADSERSLLRFHIHAPFASTVARDSIVKDHDENKALIDGIAELCCESIHILKKNQLLNVDFFSVLPNEEDEISNVYSPIYDKIIEEFEDESNSLIPTENNEFSNLENCLFTNNSIKKLLNKNDLKILINEKDINEFALNAKKNTRSDKFLNSLERRTFYEQDFVDAFSSLNSFISDNHMNFAHENDSKLLINSIDKKRNWISSKGNDWLQRLYATLYDFQENKLYSDLIPMPSIIRLANGTLNFDRKPIFFPGQNQSNQEYQFVESLTYSSGKNDEEQENARNFLIDSGVKELDESELVKLLFKDYEYPNKEQHIKDINRLVQLYKKTDKYEWKYGNLKEYFNACLFLLPEYHEEDNYFLFKPSFFAIDSPFIDTNLRYTNIYQSKVSLNSLYLEVEDLDEFLKLIIQLGAIESLKIEKVDVKKNPEFTQMWRNASGYKETSTGINIDYSITNLEKMLQDEENRFEISKLIWDVMISASKETFKAQYSLNASSSSAYSKSQIIHTLSQSDWIPNKNGEFFNPRKISRDDLPEEFEFNNDNGCLDEINFGADVSGSLNEAYEIIQRKTGISKDELNFFKNTTPEERAQVLATYEKIKKDNEKKALRDSLNENQGSGASSEFVNTQGEDEIILDDQELQAGISQENSNVSTETARTNTSRKRQNKEDELKVRNFLYKQYKGHCQVCGDTFEGNESKNYFEIFAMNRGKNSDVKRKGNTLSLCPKHHAIFNLKLPKFNFLDSLPDGEITLEVIKQSYDYFPELSKNDIKDIENSGFYALNQSDDFYLDSYLLPITIFGNSFVIKFSQEHLQNFIEVLNEN